MYILEAALVKQKIFLHNGLKLYLLFCTLDKNCQKIGPSWALVLEIRIFCWKHPLSTQFSRCHNPVKLSRNEYNPLLLYNLPSLPQFLIPKHCPSPLLCPYRFHPYSRFLPYRLHQYRFHSTGSIPKGSIPPFHPYRIHPNRIHPNRIHPYKIHPYRFHPYRLHPNKFQVPYLQIPSYRFHPHRFHPTSSIATGSIPTSSSL